MTKHGVRPFNISEKMVRVVGYDSASINAAIGELQAGGGAVYLPAGTYSITSPIVINASNISLIGAGQSTILKQAATSSQPIISNQVADYTIIRDMKLDGDGAVRFAASAYQDIGIDLDTSGGGSNYVKIINCSIYDIGGSVAGANGDAVYIHGGGVCSYLEISGCLIELCLDDGIDQNAGTDVEYARITNNEINLCNDNGIDTESILYCVIANNTIQDCGQDASSGAGIEVESEGTYDPCKYNSVIGNTIAGCPVGIRLASAQHTSVMGNSIYNCADTGITLSTGNGNTAASLYNTIVGNVVDTCAVDGIAETSGSPDFNLFSMNQVSNITGDDYVTLGSNTVVMYAGSDGKAYFEDDIMLQDSAGKKDITAKDGSFRSLTAIQDGNNPALNLKASSGQTSDIIHVRNNANALLASMSAIGRWSLASQSDDPTTAFGAGAGTTGSLGIVFVGGDSAGKMTVTTGNSPPAGPVELVTVTFDTPFVSAPAVTIFNSDASSAAGNWFVTSTTDDFTIWVRSTALAANTPYGLHYQVMGF